MYRVRRPTARDVLSMEISNSAWSRSLITQKGINGLFNWNTGANHCMLYNAKVRLVSTGHDKMYLCCQYLVFKVMVGPFIIRSF